MSDSARTVEGCGHEPLLTTYLLADVDVKHMAKTLGPPWKLAAHWSLRGLGETWPWER